jgi:hypothetical protein
MNVYFHIIGPGPDVRWWLAQDGWDVERRPHGVLRARHPHVRDEQAARWRLLRLGLLLSASPRIEFQPR